MKVTEKSNRVLPEEGVHNARLIRIVDVGTQYNEKFDSSARKVRFTFELVDTGHVFNEEKGEQPFVIDRQYTLSLNKKATLRVALEAWRGKSFTEEELEEGFELDDVLNTAGQVQVQYTEDGKYANIGSLMASPKGVRVKKAQNDVYLFDLDDFDEDLYLLFPEWLQQQIADSPEYKELKNTEELETPKKKKGRSVKEIL